MKKGIFVNTRKTNCSIYSSGLMIFESLRFSQTYRLDYVEINQIDVDKLYKGLIESSTARLDPYYDFYIFNYHHTTMRDVENINSANFDNLPGKKICIILEMNRNDPFPYMNPVGFTDLLVVDPTMEYPDSRVHAFPRPILNFRPIKKFDRVPDIPVIGSFGYATPNKGFEFIVAAASMEFEQAHIRINIPHSTYADPMFGDSIKNYIKEECKKYQRSGISVEFTQHYFSDNELVDWCAENTINCFFYMRNSPGLAAATDQAIESGSALAVSENTTFRHIHNYIKPYPQISLSEAILTSSTGIEKMRQDWCTEKCVSKLQEILWS